jgi:hypothetical protein
VARIQGQRPWATERRGCCRPPPRVTRLADGQLTVKRYTELAKEGGVVHNDLAAVTQHPDEGSRSNNLEGGSRERRACHIRRVECAGAAATGSGRSCAVSRGASAGLPRCRNTTRPRGPGLLSAQALAKPIGRWSEVLRAAGIEMPR